MRNNTKSSITLPAAELDLVTELMRSRNAKTKVEVIRRGLSLLKETTDRSYLRESFRKASEATREIIQSELKELDAVTDEGLD